MSGEYTTMKKLVIIILVPLLLFTDIFAFGETEDEIGKITKMAVDHFMNECGLSGDGFDIAEPRQVDLTGQVLGNGHALCWIVNINYPVIHYVDLVAACRLAILDFTVIIDAKNYEIVNSTEPAAFLEHLKAFKELLAALRILEDLERAQGDFLTWTSEGQALFLERYKASFILDNFVYPPPEGLQVWEALEIACDSICEKNNFSADDLMMMSIEVYYQDRGSGAKGGDRCTVTIYDEQNSDLRYSVHIDTQTGAGDY